MKICCLAATLACSQQSTLQLSVAFEVLGRQHQRFEVEFYLACQISQSLHSCFAKQSTECTLLLFLISVEAFLSNLCIPLRLCHLLLLRCLDLNVFCLFVWSIIVKLFGLLPQIDPKAFKNLYYCLFVFFKRRSGRLHWANPGTRKHLWVEVTAVWPWWHLFMK